MVADKSKKLKVSEKGENAEEIDGELVLSIEKLQEIQDELEKVSNSLCLVLFVFSNSQIWSFQSSFPVCSINASELDASNLTEYLCFRNVIKFDWVLCFSLIWMVIVLDQWGGKR